MATVNTNGGYEDQLHPPPHAQMTTTSGQKYRANQLPSPAPPLPLPSAAVLDYVLDPNGISTCLEYITHLFKQDSDVIGTNMSDVYLVGGAARDLLFNARNARNSHKTQDLIDRFINVPKDFDFIINDRPFIDNIFRCSYSASTSRRGKWVRRVRNAITDKSETVTFKCLRDLAAIYPGANGKKIKVTNDCNDSVHRMDVWFSAPVSYVYSVPTAADGIAINIATGQITCSPEGFEYHKHFGVPRLHNSLITSRPVVWLNSENLIQHCSRQQLIINKHDIAETMRRRSHPLNV